VAVLVHRVSGRARGSSCGDLGDPQVQGPERPFRRVALVVAGQPEGLGGGALAAAVLLAAAGIGLWAHAEWWRPVSVVGLAVSFGLMVLYFNPWFLFIQAVNAGLIVGILWLDWPSQSMVGA